MVKLLSLLAIAAAVGTSAVVATPVSTDDFLVFDKPKLALDGNTAGETVQVALKTAPASRVVVYFDAPNTKFDKCALEFTPDNYNKPQPLTVVSLPFLSIAPAERQMPITFTAFSDDCTYKHYGKSTSLPTVRDKEKTGQCQVTGDPHYRSFDTTALYHYQGEGDFYLVQSDYVTIQARQGPCFSKATCIVALAVRYGSSSFIIDANQADPNTCVQQITNKLDGATVSKTRSGTTTSVNVAFNAGSNLKVDIIGSGKDRYMNVYFDAANHLRGKLGGLCGKFDGDASNDFTARDGTVFKTQPIIDYAAGDMFNKKPGFKNTDLYKFGESWRVPGDDNLFKCRDKCTGNSGAKFPIGTPVTECKRPDAAKVVCNKPTPSLTTSSSLTTSVTATPTSVAIVTTPSVPASSSSSSSAPASSTSTQVSSVIGSATTANSGTSSSSSTTTTASTAATTNPAGGASTSTTATGTFTDPNGAPAQPTVTSTTSASTSSAATGSASSSTTAGVNTSSSSSTTAAQGTTSSSTTATTSSSSTQVSSVIGAATSITSSTTTSASVPAAASTTTTTSVPAVITTSSTSAAVPTKTQIQTSTRPGTTYVPLPPSCPKPIVVFPIPPGYRVQPSLPRYTGPEPKLPAYRPLPAAPKDVLDAAAAQCGKKIVSVDACDEDVRRFVAACEADIRAQMNPDAAYETHRLAYTHVCSRCVLSKAKEPFPDVARAAREAAKKHCFGSNACDQQCLQCTERGCLQCRDNERFEVVGGKCVPRTVVQYPVQYFAPKPVYRALADDEVTPQLSGDEAALAAEDPSYNPAANVAQDSIMVVSSAEEVKGGDDKKQDGGAGAAASSAARMALSTVAGLVAVAASLLM
ncbi:hypothetical protein H9P43_003322 [Blastocladiella emersonii ATCC 22665]|nr:hypothetical protein H9P43_003322 [Blastocladiella emersonii ATCC 22665]